MSSFTTTLPDFPSSSTSPQDSFESSRDRKMDDFNDAWAIQKQIIGISVGVSVGVFLIIAIAVAWWCLRRNKRNKKKSQWTPPNAQPESQQANPYQAHPQQSLVRNGENGVAKGYKPALDNQHQVELDNPHQVELESQTQARQYHEVNAQPLNTLAQGDRVEATDGRPQPQELPMNYRQPQPQELPVDMRNGRVEMR